jgi:hypothetical protein
MYVIFLFVIVMYVLFRFAIVMYVLLVSSNISNSAYSLKEQSADRHGPVVHINLIPHQPVFALTSYYHVPSGEGVNTNLCSNLRSTTLEANILTNALPMWFLVY